jgi:hypothetical protein
MPLDMSLADIQFLFNYAHWRLAQRGMLPEELKRSG